LLRLLKAARIARRLLSTEGVRDAGVLALMTIFAGGAAFTALERGHHEPPIDTWDGMWWSITTVTTVGYGDVSPMTTGGRVIAIVVMLVGIGFVAILTAAAAERFLRARRPEAADQQLHDRLNEIVRRLDRLEHRG
jgi:voltage-gated potassium channel